MQFGNFSVLKEGDAYILERSIFPRIILEIDFSELPHVDDIIMVDKCSAIEIAGVLREAEAFINHILDARS